VEHNRARPLLNTRWLTNANIARLALSVLLIRVVQSEASGTVGFLQALGLNNDQMLELWWIVMFGAIAGMVVSALTMTPARIQPQMIFSLAVMALGAYMDSDATNLTRPSDLYISQFLLGFGGAMFVGPTFVSGFGAVIAAPNNLVSFSVMFSITQTLGSLLGTALTGTFQVWREKYHSSILVDHLTLLDPQVAARIQSGGLGSLGAVATREANILAYNDVFLAITVLALLTMSWLLARYLWSVCVVCQPKAAHNAQTGMANVSLNNSGAR